MAGKKHEDRAFAVPVALFYGALFIVYGTHIPFMPVWLDWRGLTAGEISTVMAAPFFLRLFVTPTVAVAADRSAAHRSYLIVLSWLSLAFVLALTMAGSFWLILLFAVPLMICNSTIMPLIETIAVQGMRLRGLDYGRMRLWGSLTFVAASFLGGIAVTHFGGGAGVWLVAIGCAATVAAAHALPEQYKAAARRDVAEQGVSLWKAAEPRQLLSQGEFQLFLLAAGLVQAAHATFLTFGTLLWQSQGYSATWSGALWAVGVFAEIALFSVSGRVAGKFGAARLIAIGAAASIIRWIAMALQPPLAVLIPLQLLHGITYGASQIGAIHFIHDAIPHDKSGSAQALYATVASGIAMGCTTLLAGWLYATAGSLSYLAMAAIAAISLIAALRLMRVWDGGLLLAQPAS
jgi:PPP family 3-phenylpropionic acid transporter